MGPDGVTHTYAEALALCLGAFAEALTAAGVEHVCVCPGSRSTPLALTFARQQAAGNGPKLWVHLDERSCGYFALGLAKATRKPVAILCTSGTAAVNFAPAVVEAYQGRVPLVVLTADRPPEVRDIGANQTIDQSRLYGTSVRWFAEMLVPEWSQTAVRQMQLAAARAVAAATEGTGGPVHLNFPLREPLIPASIDLPEDMPRPSVVLRGAGVAAPSQDDIDWMLDFCGYPGSDVQQHRGVVVCGQQDDPQFPYEAHELAAALQWPIIADPFSGARGFEEDDRSCVVGSYDNYLRDPAIASSLHAERVIYFGAPPINRPLQNFIARPGTRRVLVTADNAWRDPDLGAEAIVHSDPATFCRELTRQVEAVKQRLEVVQDYSLLDSYRAAWEQGEERSAGVIDAALQDETRVSEAGVFYHLGEVAERYDAPLTIFAGNSMPVRDLEGFLPQQVPVRMLANRGASGIDGVVSSALGVAAAGQGRVVLVIGDISFYHDMNGLIAAKRFGLDATIVLVNNDGGGIFSFLAQHDDATHFEALFGTPHGLDFAPVAQLYGLHWQDATTPDAYKEALQASFARSGVSVVQVRTNREENLTAHQAIWRDVAAALRQAQAERGTGQAERADGAS